MKKYLAILIACLLVALPTAAFGGDTGFDYLHLDEQATAVSTPASGKTAVYANADGTALIIINDAAASVTLGAGSGDNTLDNAYDQPTAGAGKAITVDTGAIALSNTDADANALLTLNHSPSSSADSTGIIITIGSSSSGPCIELENAGSGYDIEGTAGWYVTAAGAMTVDSLTASTVTVSTLEMTSVSISSTVGIGGNVTIDDGTTDTPYLIFRDGTDEDASIYKASGANLIVTLGSATDSLEIEGGCLKVGDGAPTTR